MSDYLSKVIERTGIVAKQEKLEDEVVKTREVDIQEESDFKGEEPEIPVDLDSEDIAISDVLIDYKEEEHKPEEIEDTFKEESEFIDSIETKGEIESETEHTEHIIESPDKTENPKKLEVTDLNQIDAIEILDDQIDSEMESDSEIRESPHTISKVTRPIMPSTPKEIQPQYTVDESDQPAPQMKDQENDELHSITHKEMTINQVLRWIETDEEISDIHAHSIKQMEEKRGPPETLLQPEIRVDKSEAKLRTADEPTFEKDDSLRISIGSINLTIEEPRPEDQFTKISDVPIRKKRETRPLSRLSRFYLRR
ncbi:MAG: hypothetical protein ACFFED_03155 [Candidatus Thorarchaeota archaeon]